MKRISILTLLLLIIIGLSGLFLISFAEADKWTKKADMPTPRTCLSASSVNGRIYAIGGTQDYEVALPTVEEYDTGFADTVTSIKAKGKLATSWSEIKSNH